ncbi:MULTISPECIES: YhdP family protein [Gammaproteobacteria]|uniref:YhdP family protein n=1 Tax=Gammaproteobacteria TaxID=1236 RepID=UPI000DD09632|nr:MULTISPECIES: YhdP family protein [Gammaproteobacteria]RTE86371.1 TIGR02099 family protein [Aliidiomarina sp. B3213]TCZ91719.1 TIGR02099 family protein [Lysobacter sp. N42]
MKITRALAYAINKLWLTVAVLLVTAAILLSIARIALPYADRYKSEIEALVLSQYGQPVDIGELSATWSMNGPALVLKDVQLLNENSEQISFTLGETRARLNFWDSLLGWHIVFDDFELVSVELDIYRHSEGELPALPLLEAIERLLFEQLTQFSVEQSLIRLHDQQGGVRTISIQDLSWLNRNGRRQGVGRFNIPNVTANHLDFIIDLNSSVGEPLAGSMYVEASHLDISPWITQLTHTAEIQKAEFNLRGWLDFADGQFTQGQVHFDENRLEWVRGESEHVLTTSPTTWLLSPQVDGWLMNSNPMFIRLDQENWPVDTVAWEYLNGTHTWNVSNLEIPNASPVWGLFGSPGEEMSAWSEGIQPTGDIHEIQLRLTQEQQWQFYLLADDLSWQPHRGIPGVDGLKFEFWSERNQGRFEISGEQVMLSSPSTFASDQLLKSLRWEGFWSRNEEGWTVRLPNARFNLPDAAIVQSLRVEGGKNRSPHVEWSVSSGEESLNTLDGLSLLPLQLGQGVSDYLQGAMRSGNVENLRMLWRGALNDFPYRGGSGVFQASAQLYDLEFRFSPNWPTLRTETATISYQNEELSISTPAAMLAEVEMSNVVTRIPEISQPERQLIISAETQENPATLQQLFAQSPLANSVGAAMEQVVGSAPVTGAFTLTIPLADPQNTQVEGYANIVSQDVFIQPINTEFTGVSGRLEFTKDTLSFAASRVGWKGLLFNVEVTGQGSETDSSAGQYQLTIAMDSLWNSTRLVNSLNLDALAPMVRGDVRSSGELTLTFNGEGVLYDGLFRSDLTPVESDLPEPFLKAPGEIWFWETTLSGNLDGLRLTTGVEDHFQFDASKVTGVEGFNAATLQLGETSDAVELATGESQLAVELASFDIEAWQPLSTLKTDGEESERAAFIPALSSISANIDEVNVVGLPFHEVSINLQRADNLWQGRIDATETRIEVDYAEHSDSVRLTADFLELSGKEILGERSPEEPTQEQQEQQESSVGETKSAWLNSLPPFEFICRICRYNGNDFGRVTLGFDPRIEDGQLRHLRILKSGARVELTGGWIETDGEVYSNLEGEFETSNISALLQQWGFDSVVRDAAMEVESTLIWEGGLLDFNMQSLDGSTRYNMESGYLRDVDDGGARLFSVLSLDSLVRKLTLDFRDIFARGMFFNSFAGNLEIVDGVFTTNNSTMLGSAGDLEIQGSTDWNTQLIDYKLSYTPKVTSSLPVLLAWMVNPPSGIAALLIDRVLHDAKVISRLEYRMTGTVQNPEVNEVRRDSTEVELPEEAIQELEQLQESSEAQGDSTNENSPEEAGGAAEDESTAAEGETNEESNEEGNGGNGE